MHRAQRQAARATRNHTGLRNALGRLNVAQHLANNLAHGRGETNS